MFVFTAENKELVALVKSGSVTYDTVRARLSRQCNGTHPFALQEYRHSYRLRRSMSAQDYAHVLEEHTKTPLLADQVQFQDMVVDLVSVCIESSKGVDDLQETTESAMSF
jgi:hypothetical protein